VLYGIASFRARVFPRPLAAFVVVGGALGFSALLAPFGLPLGLAVGAIGVWLIRSASRESRDDLAARERVPVG
jgi:hypothetical protein